MDEFVFIAKDSDKDEVLYQHQMSSVTYEPYWQALRITLSFKDYESCRGSITKVLAYIQNAPGGDMYERACRLFRAYNLLNALPLGKVKQGGFKVISKDRQDLILHHRKELRLQLGDVGYPSEWDWAVARRSCSLMSETQEGLSSLIQIHKNLRNRAKKGRKLELNYFMDILKEAISD